MFIRDRDINLRLASVRPGEDTSYPVVYTNEATRAQMPSGYRSGEEMHHLVGAELVGPFVQGLEPHEVEIMVNRFNSRGIRVGNDPHNFIGVDKKREHILNDEYSNTIHERLGDMGLESSVLEGEELAQFKNLQESISNLPLKTRLEIVDDYIDCILEPAMEVGREFRPNANGIAENKKLYQNEIAQEAQRLEKEHYQELAAESFGTKALSSRAADNSKEITKAIKVIRKGRECLDAALGIRNSPRC